MLGLKTMALSQRATALRPSPTLAMTARARAMKAEGKPVLSFAAGEPDFNTPDQICEAGIDAIRKGQTKYTASSGTPELKQAILDMLIRRHGVQGKPSEIVVSCGAKHSIYNALMTLCDPGDEVLLIAPFWMTYADQVRLAGATPVLLHTTADSGFCPSLDEVKDALTPRTKAIILNSPSNPTGAVLPAAFVQGVANLAVAHDFWMISDEIYEYLLYGAEHQSVLTCGEEARQRTVWVSGCSKTYSMTGWRIGYAWAPAAVATAMSNLQDQVTSNPTSFAQAGAVAALKMPDNEIETMRSEFAARRELVMDLLQQIPGMKVARPQGAFYAFPDVSAFLGGRFEDDAVLADALLDEKYVAVVPGSVFYGPGHLRLSYAASRADLEEGIGRIHEFLTQIPR